MNSSTIHVLISGYTNKSSKKSWEGFVLPRVLETADISINKGIYATVADINNVPHRKSKSIAQELLYLSHRR